MKPCILIKYLFMDGTSKESEPTTHHPFLAFGVLPVRWDKIVMAGQTFEVTERFFLVGSLTIKYTFREVEE